MKKELGDLEFLSQGPSETEKSPSSQVIFPFLIRLKLAIKLDPENRSVGMQHTSLSV
jgi:hypothetical protein